MAIVGAYARVDPREAQAVRARLAALPHVELFDLPDPEKVGLIVEANGLDDAHAFVKHDLNRVSGVLGVWPVYVHTEDEFAEEEECEPGVQGPGTDQLQEMDDETFAS